MSGETKTAKYPCCEAFIGMQHIETCTERTKENNYGQGYVGGCVVAISEPYTIGENYSSDFQPKMRKL